MEQIKRTEIRGIGNYYGGLWIAECKGNYYWIIENHSTDFNDITEWEAITKDLYHTLLEHNETWEPVRWKMEAIQYTGDNYEEVKKFAFPRECGEPDQAKGFKIKLKKFNDYVQVGYWLVRFVGEECHAVVNEGLFEACFKEHDITYI